MVCVHNFEKRDAMRAAMIQTLRVEGYRVGMSLVEIPPSVCDTVCGELDDSDAGVLEHVVMSIKEGRWRDAETWRDARGKIERNWVFRKRIYPPFDHRGSNQPVDVLDQYLKVLARDRPHTLKGLSTYLYQISKRSLQRDADRVQIPVIRTLGSLVTPKMREVIESAFDGKFFNDYGTAELGPISAECSARNGMHIFGTQFIVEVVDQNLKPVADGELGEVLVTDLVNHSMPLIRYRVGDLGRIKHEPCTCGSSLPRLWIEGRIHDAFATKDGSWISSHYIADQLFQYEWLHDFQLVEKRGNRLELSFVTEDKSDPLTQKKKLRSLLIEMFGDQRDIRVRETHSISPEPGGKFRWVKPLPFVNVLSNAT